MNKTIATILFAAMLTAALSGCTTNAPMPSLSPTEPTQTEPVQTEPVQTESVQTEPVQTEPVQTEPVQLEQTPAAEPAATEPPAAVNEVDGTLTEFKSDFGYTISYAADNFDYRRTEGYDEYCLKSDDVDKPFVFICVSHVGAEFVGQMKAAALGESPEACTIGKNQMQAQCSEIKEAWDGGEIIHKTYVCALNSGDALLVETQRYTEQANDPYAALLLEMVNSIVL